MMQRLVGCIGLLLLCGVSLSFAQDAYEPNDTKAEAYDLNAYNGVWLSAIDGNGVSDGSSDPDVFGITIPEGSTDLQIELTFAHAVADLDLLLSNDVGVVRSSNSIDDNETISWADPTPNDYYIIVENWDSAANPYDLRWTLTVPDPPGGGDEPGCRLDSGKGNVFMPSAVLCAVLLLLYRKR